MCEFFGNATHSWKLPLLPITNEFINDDGVGYDFFVDYLDGCSSSGIPHTLYSGMTLDKLYNGTIKNKFYENRTHLSSTDSTNLNNTIKLNPAFTCYCPLKVEKIRIV